MAVPHSIARYLTLGSFVFNVAAQGYGMLSTPNMQTIHAQNLSFFSPAPAMIAGFFAPQQLVQIAWITSLWRKKAQAGAKERKEVELMTDYTPYYVIANISVALWMFAWNSEHLKTANIFVLIETLTQLAFLTTRLPKLDTLSTSSILTHVVTKTYAAIGVLDLLHNTSIAYFKDEPATLLVKILTGVAFGIGSSVSDWIFGGSLAYVLLALCVGQFEYSRDSSWPKLLGAYAIGAAVIVAVKNYTKPPYGRVSENEYERLEEE